MLRAVASKFPPTSRMIGRAAIAARSSATSRTTTRKPAAVATTTTTRRAFHDYGNPLPEPEFTPAETILLDLSAWIVAFALIYVPNSGTSEELDDETVDDVKHTSSRKKNQKIAASPRSSTTSTTTNQDEKDQWETFLSLSDLQHEGCTAKRNNTIQSWIFH